MKLARSPVARPRPPAPPRVEEDRGGGGGGDWVLLTTARDGVLAHLIQGRLAQESIECMMDESNPAPGAWLKPFGDPMAPVRIYVRRRDYEQATIALYEVDHEPPDPEAAGPPGVRAITWATIAVVVISAMLFLLEIFGFAPCVIGAFCM